MGLKWDAIGNNLGEHIRNLGNILGQRKNEKIPRPLRKTKNLKENEIKALWVHAEPSHWLHEISPKLFVTIFGLG